MVYKTASTLAWIKAVALSYICSYCVFRQCSWREGEPISPKNVLNEAVESSHSTTFWTLSTCPSIFCVAGWKMGVKASLLHTRVLYLSWGKVLGKAITYAVFQSLYSCVRICLCLEHFLTERKGSHSPCWPPLFWGHLSLFWTWCVLPPPAKARVSYGTWPALLLYLFPAGRERGSFSCSQRGVHAVHTCWPCGKLTIEADLALPLL